MEEEKKDEQATHKSRGQSISTVLLKQSYSNSNKTPLGHLPNEVAAGLSSEDEKSEEEELSPSWVHYNKKTKTKR